MNRHERRTAKSRERRLSLKFSEIDSKFDIQVDGKYGQVVMAADWSFTHIRVTRLPPHLEKAVPLAFASAESLGWPVALALHRRAWPLRVAWWLGEGADTRIETFGSPPSEEKGADLALYAEYVPPSPVGVAGSA
jgi:hypothetical protein